MVLPLLRQMPEVAVAMARHGDGTDTRLWRRLHGTARRRV